MTFASIPSPSTSVWHLGPFPLRAYALFIVLGIVVAAYIADKRMTSRGAPPLAILDVVVWAVPFGIVGARIYHIITSWQLYFGANGKPSHMLYIWEGGLGIWGAVAGGMLGAWIACRKLKMPVSFVADALAPALPVAQAIGRLGNWFNNELYGRMTTLPWGLKVHQQMNDGKALTGPDGKALYLPGLYHPAFLYELIWDLGVAGLVFCLDRRYKFGRGRAFAVYVMAYTAGRAWIEALRIDDANHIAGLRVNDWVSILVFLGALIYFIRVKGERFVPEPVGPEGDTDAESGAAIDPATADADETGAAAATDEAAAAADDDATDDADTGDPAEITAADGIEADGAPLDGSNVDGSNADGSNVDGSNADETDAEATGDTTPPRPRAKP